VRNAIVSSEDNYKKEFPETLSWFASFAAGFSYLSLLTGMFQTFHLGYGPGGPAFFWTWPLVFVGQFLVALCFAELAVHYPLAGSVYQWSKYTGSWAVGWLAGWVYLGTYIVTLAAVVIALQTTLPQIAPWSVVFKDRTHNAIFLGCVLIGFTTVVNSIGVELMARLNNIGVFTELAGVVLLAILLACRALRGPEVVLDTAGKGDGEVMGYLTPFLMAALMASFVMYGFDTAGALAEETLSPRRQVPKAILQALAAAGVLGGLLLLFALMAAPALNDPLLAKDEGGLPLIVRDTLGPQLGGVFLWNVIFAIIVCALAVQAGAVRLIFAMARDNTLPFSRALSHVSETSHTPILPAILSGVAAVLILLVNFGSTKLLEVIIVVAIVWANIAYLLVTVPLLVSRLRGWPDKGGCDEPGLFRLGRWGVPVNLLAVVWGIALIVNMAWPREAIYGPLWYQRYAALLFTGALFAVGGAYYWFVQRHKPKGPLPEHRADAMKDGGARG
jgi:urea carboxylase system permease